MTIRHLFEIAFVLKMFPASKNDKGDGLMFWRDEACGRNDDMVICPVCERKVATPRYSSHLESCKGKGRMSSR